ncbi:hypothetical protein [Streptomyces atratus]|uniref:hypothetical protein n=1 Tax=Streptomyces atratus TaxID=1893 RepID=UPI0033D31A50
MDPKIRNAMKTDGSEIPADVIPELFEPFSDTVGAARLVGDSLEDCDPQQVP